MAGEPLDPSFGRTVTRLAKQVEMALAPVELSLAQYRLLGWLGQGEQASSRLAERMDVSPPSVTALVDGLCARALVERRVDPADRRRLPLHLTPAGERLLADADRLVNAHLAGLADELDGAGRAKVQAAAEQWRVALDRHRDRKLSQRAAGSGSKP